MSRKKPNRNADHVDGVVKIVCPASHPVGRVLAQPGAQFHFLDGNFLTKPGFEGETKVRLRCPFCELSGSHPDIQGSWERIRGLALENLKDPTRPYALLMLGG